MASLPQHPQRNVAAPAALLLVVLLLLHFSPSCVSSAAPAAAPAVVPTPAPTPLQCPPGEYPQDLNGTLTCCAFQLICSTIPAGGTYANSTSFCCPKNTVCVFNLSPFATCAVPPPDKCTNCLPYDPSTLTGNSCLRLRSGDFCCNQQQCGYQTQTNYGFCCDQGEETQCTSPVQGVASPTVTEQKCCKPGKVICDVRCCDAANCMPVAGAGTLGPYTCNETGEYWANEKQGEYAPLYISDTCQCAAFR